MERFYNIIVYVLIDYHNSKNFDGNPTRAAKGRTDQERD